MINRFEHFTMDIFSITRSWNRLANEEMKKYGLRGAYGLYLVMIAGSEGSITAAKLADLCQRDKADVSRAVAAFQKKGILEPYGESKYRASLILTKEGKELASQISRRASEVIGQAGQDISQEQSISLQFLLTIYSLPFRKIGV